MTNFEKIKEDLTIKQVLNIITGKYTCFGFSDDQDLKCSNCPVNDLKNCNTDEEEVLRWLMNEVEE